MIAPISSISKAVLLTHTFEQGIAKRRSRAKQPARQALILFGLLLGSLGALASTAPTVVAASGLALITIIALLWRSKAPPILLLPPVYQWSEVSLPPISTIWLGVPLQSLSMRGADLEDAAYYGLIGVVMLAFGLRLAVQFGKTGPLLGNLQFEVQSLSFKSVSRAAFTLIAIGYLFGTATAFAGPARELLNAASELKTAGFFILAYWCLSRRRNMGILAAVFGLEIIFGMTGFFAEFKNSLLALVIAAIIARPKFSRLGLVTAVAAGILLVGVATFWSAIKGEYRNFVNQGTGAQVVLVPIDERVSFIGRAAFEFSIADAERGFDLLIARHGYIDFLAQTMRYVPSGRPHENGAFTQAVVSHIAMPRIFFPGKTPLPNDTEVMAKYTGQHMMWDGNTSISLGHLAELYIDFGYFGGLLGMMVIGLIVGGIFRVLVGHRGSSDLLKAGLCVMAALPLAYFGTAYVKLIGALVLISLIAIALQVVGLRYMPWLSAMKAARSQKRGGQMPAPVRYR